jgi:YHS domain-containing protein
MGPQKPETYTACGDRITELYRYPRVLYQGREIFFCTVDCLKQYQRSPAEFMAGKVVHTNSSKTTKTG